MIDLPPNYDNVVRIHKPMDEKPSSSSSSPGRMTYYKNRAGEMVSAAKVYVYRPKSSSSGGGR